MLALIRPNPLSSLPSSYIKPLVTAIPVFGADFAGRIVVTVALLADVVLSVCYCFFFVGNWAAARAGICEVIVDYRRREESAEKCKYKGQRES